MQIKTIIGYLYVLTSKAQTKKQEYLMTRCLTTEYRLVQSLSVTFWQFTNTVVPPYTREICSKTPCGCCNCW